LVRILILGLLCGALLAAPVAGFGQTTNPFEQGKVLFQQRRWAEAAAVFEQAEKIQPGATEALLYRGKCLVNLGEFSAAGSALQSFTAAHPASEDGAYLLAYVRFRENQAAESLRLYTVAAKLKTPSSDDLKIVALDYVLLNDLSDATHYLELALKMDPANTEALYHLGRVRYQQNRFDDAIEVFRTVLKREPTNAKAADNLGLSLEARNQTPEAIEQYRKAIELDKAGSAHSEQPYLNLAILLEKTGRPDESLGLLTTAEEIAPRSAPVHYERGKILFNQKQSQDARREIEKAIELNPKDAPAHYLLGRIYHAQGEKEQAAREFKLTDELMHAADAKSSGMATGSGPR
jgi:tetratricopeptide (TPR) repeat protein